MQAVNSVNGGFFGICDKNILKYADDDGFTESEINVYRIKTTCEKLNMLISATKAK